jgi:hypothetical protein
MGLYFECFNSFYGLQDALGNIYVTQQTLRNPIKLIFTIIHECSLKMIRSSNKFCEDTPKIKYEQQIRNYLKKFVLGGFLDQKRFDLLNESFDKIIRRINNEGKIEKHMIDEALSAFYDKVKDINENQDEILKCDKSSLKKPCGSDLSINENFINTEIDRSYYTRLYLESMTEGWNVVFPTNIHLGGCGNALINYRKKIMKYVRENDEKRNDKGVLVISYNDMKKILNSEIL